MALMHHARYTQTGHQQPGTTRRVELILLLAAWLCCPVPVNADEHDTEYQVKAAFLYNFAQFVSWPQPLGDHFRLCVIGSNPFGLHLDQLIGQSVQDSILVVDQYDNVGHVQNCQMAYISPSLKQQLRQVLAGLAGYPILTISDIEAFTDAGGMIGLRLFDHGLRFDINHVSAEAVGLSISSKLLSLSRRVSTGD